MLLYPMNGNEGKIIIDLQEDGLDNVSFGIESMRSLNNVIRKSLINGLSSNDVDRAIGFTIGSKLNIKLDKNLAGLLWTNSDTLSSIIKKNVKKFVYLLNEYIEIDDINTVMSVIASTLILKEQGRIAIINTIEKEKEYLHLLDVLKTRL